MRTPARLLAIPVVAALALASCGDDDGSDSGATTTAVTTAAPTTTAPTTTPPTTAAATTVVPPTTGDEQPAPPDVVEITLKVGLDSGPDRVETVRLGQQVVITMQSDQDEEYHLHGYDLEQKAAAGVEASFEFVADKPGRFELESHVTDGVLLVLEVVP